ncbi:hypothetical protein K456DRAFT_1766872 [Colletotrichum gloeosporioides 23]|nr:hypothetical protein K456DRAFT_1766872 [Colletotrichum gloeosporioides 23]
MGQRTDAFHRWHLATPEFNQLLNIICPKYLTRKEGEEIMRQFNESWIDEKQVLWSGVAHATVEEWANQRGMQTLTSAMGDLMNWTHPKCRRLSKTSVQWTRYMKGVSAIFAWKIAQGHTVTLLTPPPPVRFHPSGLTNYQDIEEPVLKGAVDGTVVGKIVAVHPEVEGAEDMAYEYWPKDQVTNCCGHDEPQWLVITQKSDADLNVNVEEEADSAFLLLSVPRSSPTKTVESVMEDFVRPRSTNVHRYASSGGKGNRMKRLKKDTADGPVREGRSYEPKAYENVDRSPCLRRKTRRGHARDRPTREQVTKDPNESSESSKDESRWNMPATPTPTERRARGRNPQSQGGQDSEGTRRSERLPALRPRGGGEGGAGKNRHRSYCTQKCLLGLVRDGVLDPKCPNILLHGRKPSDDSSYNHGSGRADARHPIDRTGFVKLLGEQLKQTLDDGITPLGQGGARGVLFKISLLAYGYTFVSKGTVRAFIEDLEQEAAVYERLRPIQGKHVPVFLGAIDLRPLNRIYYYDHRVYVVHMTFLSWGGHDLYSTGSVDGRNGHLEEMAMRSLRAIHYQGVVHRDMREENMLFNEEVGGVMIIDFERAQLLTPPRRPLTQLVPNKRRWTPELEKGSKLSVKSTGRDGSDGVFSGDIEMHVQYKDTPDDVTITPLRIGRIDGAASNVASQHHHALVPSDREWLNRNTGSKKSTYEERRVELCRTSDEGRFGAKIYGQPNALPPPHGVLICTRPNFVGTIRDMKET